MKNKKIIFYIITTVFIFLGFAPKTNAAGGILFSANSISSKAGQEAVLVLSQDTFTNGSPAPSSYSFRVTYTSTDFTAFSILPGASLGATPLKTVSCSVVSAGIYDCQITGDLGSPIGDGQVALLVFTVKSGLSNKTSSVALSNVVATGVTPTSNNLAITSTGGSVIVDSTVIPVKFSIPSGSGNMGATVSLNISLDKTGTAETPDTLFWDVLYNPADISSITLLQIQAMEDAGVFVSCLEAAVGDFKCSIPNGYSAVAASPADIATMQFVISNSTSKSSIPILLSGAISGSLETGSYQPTQVSGSTITVLNAAVPTLSIGSPSASLTNSGPITYIVTYTGADTVTLANGDVTINKTGTANGTVAVSGSGTTTRTVTISSITGDGTLGITLATGTASNATGSALGAGPSTTFTADNTAPTVPAGLSATAVSTSGINLSWTASTDTVGVTGYKVFRNSVQVGTSATNSYSDTGLTASTQYTYTISAYDAAGNNSTQSSSASATTQAQVTSGTVIAPVRAVDWTGAGAGTIPNRTTICQTLNPGATAAQINSALAACNNGVVFLNAGTYSIASPGINITKGNVTLRGAGPDQTKLVFTAAGHNSCNGLGASFCIIGDASWWSGAPGNTANWTAAYAKGTTQITLSNVTGLSAGKLLILDQADDTSDDGSIYNCQTINKCTQQGTDIGRAGRGQHQTVTVTAVNGNVVTITPSLADPNWRTSQNPGAWISL